MDCLLAPYMEAGTQKMVLVVGSEERCLVDLPGGEIFPLSAVSLDLCDFEEKK
jgi:hypothetical protein